ncbi:uncharacterized protein LOC114364737 [Ostrinia furnacalis]|uniref:uncharacterized protein LOC114364737 n=1 Tax=Ostrinia furnacalis TaxID=93504 RepID=UPI00103CF8E2|nr:uncharacterized protein LOC114364737 [Ostrinia furnacalis]
MKSVSDTLKNARLTISALTAEDSGVYGCHAHNAYSSHSSQVQISVQGIFIPSHCTDNPFFADCKLIVRSKFCNHQYYSRRSAYDIGADGGGQRRVRLPRAQRLQLALLAGPDLRARHLHPVALHGQPVLRRLQAHRAQQVLQPPVLLPVLLRVVRAGRPAQRARGGPAGRPGLEAQEVAGPRHTTHITPTKISLNLSTLPVSHPYSQTMLEACVKQQIKRTAFNRAV